MRFSETFIRYSRISNSKADAKTNLGSNNRSLPARVDAVVMKLHSGHGCIGSRRPRGEGTRKTKRLPQHSTKPPPENHVDYEIDGRINHHQQLTYDVEAQDGVRQKPRVGRIAFCERYELEHEFRGFAHDERQDDDDQHDGCVLVALGARYDARWRV